MNSTVSPLRPRHIIPTSLADQVYAYLRSAIVLGEIPPGERIVELEIAERVGTSQGPVREALQRLQYDGLVERRARSATVVIELAMDQIYELFSIRSVVESFAIRRTIRTINSAQCQELQGLVEAMRHAALQDDMATLVEHDMYFHRQICAWSDHPILLHVWTPLYTQIQRFVAQTHRQYFPDLVEIADTHQPIVNVLRRGDQEQASQLIRDHIMLIWSRIETR